MKAKELIAELEKFPDYYDVTITDGNNAYCYRGEYEVTEFEYNDGTKVVDIGIGGTLE